MYLAAYEEGGAIGAYVVCRRVDEVADEPVGDVNVVGTVFGGGLSAIRRLMVSLVEEGLLVQCGKGRWTQGNRIKTPNKKACDYSILGSITVSLRRLKYT